MASEPRYSPPEPAPLAPVERAPRRPRWYAIVGIAAISALIGAAAGSGATILTAQRLSQAGSPAARNLVAPLAPITNTLTEESAVINVAATAGKSVVEIKTRVTSPDLFVQQTQQGIGSGFIVSSDGYIVTNNHVVEGATQLQVILRDQSRPYDARIVGTSPQDDIAVIKIDARDLPALSFGDSHSLRVGQLAKLLNYFRANGVREAVMAGQIAPGNLFDLHPDWKALLLLARQGLNTGPKAEVSLDEPMANSSMLVLPNITAPASHRFWVTVDS